MHTILSCWFNLTFDWISNKGFFKSIFRIFFNIFYVFSRFFPTMVAHHSLSCWFNLTFDWISNKGFNIPDIFHSQDFSNGHLGLRSQKSILQGIVQSDQDTDLLIAFSRVIKIESFWRQTSTSTHRSPEREVAMSIWSFYTTAKTEIRVSVGSSGVLGPLGGHRCQQSPD